MDERDEASVRAWLAAWGDHVAAADVDGARALFDGSVVGFGTRAEVADGIDRLVDDQWRHVWPAISAFSFDVGGAHVWVADDRRQAVIATLWSSTGRRGRATVVVRRAEVDGRGAGCTPTSR
ncbi:MAG: hypothetical protein ACRDJP_02075 [Actinomycetota bacterium]